MTAVQKRIGQALGLPFHKVIVKNKRAGGAFGGKERMHLALIASVSSLQPKPRSNYGIGTETIFFSSFSIFSIVFMFPYILGKFEIEDPSRKIFKNQKYLGENLVLGTFL